MNRFRLQDLALRPMLRTDLDRVLEWRNSERVRHNMYNTHIITPDEHRAWFDRVGQSRSDDYRIFTLAGRDVGVVGFTGIRRDPARAFWAFYLGEADAPRGAGSAMEFVALDHAFGSLQLDKLACEVIDFNDSVIKMHKRFGFVEEGRFAEDVRRAGCDHAVVRLALFRRAWLARRDEMRARIFEE